MFHQESSTHRRTMWAGVVAIIASLTLLLSGCSNPTDSNTKGPEGKTTIILWYQYTGNNASHAMELIDEYNASQANYEVVGEFGAPSDQFNAKIINALNTKTAPNMILGDSTPQSVGRIVDIDGIVPLDTFLNNPASKITRANFTEAMLGSGTFNGKLYAIPTDAGSFMICYNKKLFEEAGITTLPTTWAELHEVAKKLTKGTEQYGMYLPIGTGEWPVFTWQAMLWSAGGQFLSADNTKVEFNSDAGIRALNAWVDMVKDGSAYPQSLSTPNDKNGSGALTSGIAAMQINGAYNLGVLDEGLGADNVGVFKLPGIDHYAMNLGGPVTYILRGGTEAQEAAAWDFFQWWVSPETQTKWAKATGYLPTNLDTADDPNWQAYLDSNPRIATFAEGVSYAQLRPSIIKYGEVSEALSLQIERALLLQVSSQEALATAAANAQAVLDG